tara:strand:- start:301 stop:954 length:654 start_codon:yes stop_codon:yes gene_type:complete
MKIKPNYSLTMNHLSGAKSRKVFLIAPMVYSAKWATNQPEWASKQKIFVHVDGADFLLLGSEYQVESISKREQAQRHKARHLSALAMLWHCHREASKPVGWIADNKPTATDEYIGNQLHRKLTLLERRAQRATTNLCNIPDYQAKCDRILEKVTNEVRELFGGSLPAGFTVNRDPRGYALKLESDPLRLHWATPRESIDSLRRDWGGDFILAPSNFN